MRSALLPTCALVLALIETSVVAHASWSASGPVGLSPGFAAAALPSGRVIACGGFEDSALARASRAVFVWDPSTNLWASGPPLLDARAEHQLVSLGDGRVIAIGGRDGQRELSSTEIFTAGSKAWQLGGARAYSRLGSTSVLLKDGHVLSLGGDFKPGVDTCPAELLDPRTRQWETISELPPTCGVEAVGLGDGRVFLAGGWDRWNARRDAGIWNPKARTFVAAAPLTKPRARHGLFALWNGSVAAVGGFVEQWNSASSAEIFFPQSNTWIGVPISTASWSKPIVLENGDLIARTSTIGWRWRPRDGNISQVETAPLGNGFPLALRGGSFMLLASGKPAQIFNAAGRPLGRWQAVPMRRPVTEAFSLTTLLDGRALLAAGSPILNGDAAKISELLDPQTLKWSSAGKLVHPRARHATALLADGRVLLASGVDLSKSDPPRRRKSTYGPPGISGAMLKSSEVWSPTQGFRSAGELLEPRADAAPIAFPDGSVAVIGGYQLTYGPDYVHAGWWLPGRPRILASVEVWSPARDRWGTGPAMSEPRAHHTATLLADGRVLVVGGNASGLSGVTLSTPAELWEPAKNRWIPTAPPRQTRSYHCAARLADGRVLVAGGYLPSARGTNAPGQKLSTAEIWDPRTNAWSSAHPMSVTRGSFAMLVLSDGRVLVAGGTEGNATTPEVWDPATDTWAFTGPPAHPIHQNAQLTLLRDGRVLFVDDKAAQIWAPR